MKLFLLSQDENVGYDTHDSAVVAAKNEDEAKLINISDYTNWDDMYSSWCSSPDNVTVTYLGEAKEGTKTGIILASFNAG